MIDMTIGKIGMSLGDESAYSMKMMPAVCVAVSENAGHNDSIEPYQTDCTKIVKLCQARKHPAAVVLRLAKVAGHESKECYSGHNRNGHLQPE